jgi:hypothetical protein
MHSEQGLQSCAYSPQPDFMAANKINLERMLEQPVVPPQAATDTVQHQEVDNIYLVCIWQSFSCAERIKHYAMKTSGRVDV